MSEIIGSIQIAKKTKAAWDLQNPILMHGQIAAEADGAKIRFKVGDGVNVYTARPYVTVGTTDDVTEGAANLYFTNGRADARADARITAAKNVNNGIAGLDAGGLIPAALLPSYVDDVLEYANLAAFPVSGVTGKMYVALDTNKVYRWSGSVYVEISASPGSTDAVTEGVTNLYFTTARVQTVGDARYAILAHTHTFASLTSKPTTLGGYGITDALPAANPTFSGTMNGGVLNLGTSGLRGAILGVNGSFTQNPFYHSNFNFGSGSGTSFSFALSTYATNLAITGNAVAVNIQFIVWVSGTACGYYQYSIISNGSTATVSAINSNPLGAVGTISVSAVRVSNQLTITITGTTAFQCQGYGVALAD